MRYFFQTFSAITGRRQEPGDAPSSQASTRHGDRGNEILIDMGVSARQVAPASQGRSALIYQKSQERIASRVDFDFDVVEIQEEAGTGKVRFVYGFLYDK